MNLLIIPDPYICIYNKYYHCGQAEARCFKRSISLSGFQILRTDTPYATLLGQEDATLIINQVH